MAGGLESESSGVYSRAAAEQLADGMVCGSRSICLLRGDSGEAHSGGYLLPVMGLRAWEACSGSKSRVGGVDWRVLKGRIRAAETGGRRSDSFDGQK